MARTDYTIGIDEVGRGALAGPVVVAAFALPRGARLQSAALGPLKDSKKLAPARRKEWAAFLKNKFSGLYVISRVSPRIIDGINISAAANRAAHRALLRLIGRLGVPVSRCRVYLDGGLYIRDKKTQCRHGRTVQTIVKGDEKIPAIAAASILAKVSRDAAMARLDGRLDGYGFSVHKGYGTSAHMRALREKGRSPAHRESFTRNLARKGE